LVAAYVSTDKPLLYLIARPDIKDAKALRGGIIGHGGTRGSHYHATVAMVRHLGLDPEKDVKLISTIDVTQGLTARFSGGEQYIVFGSDYPHGDSKWPETVSRIRSAGFSEITERRILGENAARLYKLDLPLG
jgi:predicted TIM-barrel fold metal-dependent hydrolase